MPAKGTDKVPVPLSVTKPTCQRDYKVDYFHVDLNNRVKLSSLFNYMQDIAGIHANELKCGYDVLAKLDITWIMLRAKIRMEYYPCWRDVITVKTSTNGVDKLCAVREFEFYDVHGNYIGYAITYWILYYIAGQKVLRMNHNGVVNGFELPEHLMKQYGEYEKLSRIKEQGELISESIRKAQYNDIDTNIHVNNARYIEWLTDAVYENADANTGNQKLIKSLHVGFTSSVKLGDIVKIKKFRSLNDDNNLVLRVYKDEVEYLQTEIEFFPIDLSTLI